MESRHELCTKFQTEEDVRVAVLSITAASTGLTLTRANLVVFAELHFTPGTLQQAEDRAHRIGQLSPVNIHFLLAKGTADDLIWPLIQRKLQTLESLGLGKNEFSSIKTVEHDPSQTKIDKFFSKPKSEEIIIE